MISGQYYAVQIAARFSDSSGVPELGKIRPEVRGQRPQIAVIVCYTLTNSAETAYPFCRRWEFSSGRGAVRRRDHHPSAFPNWVSPWPTLPRSPIGTSKRRRTFPSSGNQLVSPSCRRDRSHHRYRSIRLTSIWLRPIISTVALHYGQLSNCALRSAMSVLWPFSASMRLFCAPSRGR